MKFNPIAIVGQSCLLPGILNTEELWDALAQGRNLLSEATQEDWGFDPKAIIDSKSSPDRVPHSIGGHVRNFESLFDPEGFEIPSSKILEMDSLFQWALHCGRELLKEIDWKPSRKRTGIILGNLSYPNRGLNKLAKEIYFKNTGISISNQTHPRNRFISGYPAKFLAEALGIDGPAFCLDAACASSLYAIKNACDLLNSKEVDLAISGGINATESSFLHLGFSSLRALSRSGRLLPFSKDADGLLPSRGVAFVALRRLEDAVRMGEPILGVIRGIGLSNDGRTGSLLSPSTHSQQEAIRKAYHYADMDISELSYVETHATGTLVGDKCELATLLEVFQSSPLYLGALKANIGHSLAVSGTAALLKILASFKHRSIAPFAHIESPIDELKDSKFQFPRSLIQWDAPHRVAGINAFGFGGNNAHMIVEEYSAERHKPLQVSPKEKESVAIVGLGIHWGKYKNKYEVQKALQEESDKIFANPIESFDIDLNSTMIPPNDLKHILPQQLLLIPTLEEALEDLSKKPTENTSILVGMGCDVESTRFKLRQDFLLEGIPFDEDILPPLQSTRTLGCMPNIPANRFNLLKNWKGPSYTVFAEESSGLHALKLAEKSLQSHEVDCVLVGAVDLSCEAVHMESAKRCLDKPIPADGACVLVLKRLKDAQRDGDKIYTLLSEQASSHGLSSSYSKFGHAHAASSLLNIGAALLERFPMNIQEPKLNNSANLKTIPAHFPEIKIDGFRVPNAPKLPPVLPLYFEKKRVLFDTEAIREHGSGALSKIFGDTFKETDAYELRVRMPEAPLLLTDRVMEIDAEKASMGIGSIVTETDIPSEAWYLHQGRMLPGPAIEAGQSDLFLISYLGVDFENKGERTYRLLGCDAKFLRDMPKVGETLRFKIYVDRHVKNGKTRLFFFHYDCWIGEELFLQVRNGQAGFFSREELDASQGVIWNPKLEDFSPKHLHKVANIAKSYSREKIIAFSEGDAFACFGYDILASHSRTPSIPSGQNLFLDEVPILDAEKGYMKVIRHISKDDWFFVGHFKNDPCMPGTLMTEMAFQALSFYMTAVGLTLNCDAFRFIPALGENCKLTCRGQVLPEAKILEMELFIKDLGENKACADILLKVDGLKALLAENLAVQLIPDWVVENVRVSSKKVASFENLSCDEIQIANTVSGKASLAFGSKFRKFDSFQRAARLPSYPYTFISRVCELDAPYCGMQVGSRILSEWDIPEKHPLILDKMPFSVILEALLQPCGWLASFIGCPLVSEKEIFFRNLEGELLLKYEPEFNGTLQFDVQVTSLVRLQDTIIIDFTVSALQNGQCFVELKTQFGYFTKQALSDQKGLKLTEEEKTLLEEGLSLPYEDLSQDIFPPYFNLLDRMKIVNNSSTCEKSLSPKDWFFKAHFFQDPVMPGSLGLEAMIQALHIKKYGSSKFVLMKNFKWKYRGQVLPHNRKITVLTLPNGNSSLIVDGIKIYEATNLTL